MIVLNAKFKTHNSVNDLSHILPNYTTLFFMFQYYICLRLSMMLMFSIVNLWAKSLKQISRRDLLIFSVL